MLAGWELVDTATKDIYVPVHIAAHRLPESELVPAPFVSLRRRLSRCGLFFHLCAVYALAGSGGDIGPVMERLLSPLIVGHAPAPGLEWRGLQSAADGEA